MHDSINVTSILLVGNFVLYPISVDVRNLIGRMQGRVFAFESRLCIVFAFVVGCLRVGSWGLGVERGLAMRKEF